MAYCKNCGKELKKGEKCDCTIEVKETKKTDSKTITTASGSFDFGKTMVNIKDDLIKSIKKPIDVIEENVDANDMPKTYIMGVLVALSYGILFCGLFKVAFALIFEFVGLAAGGAGSLVSGALMSKIEIPYLKVIIYGLGVSLVSLVAYAVVMLLIPSIFKNKKLDFKKSLTFTASAFAPMIWANVICGILGLINLDFRFVFILYIIANTVVSYNFAYAYGKYTGAEDNKFGYIIALLVILSGFISGLNAYITAESFTKSIVGDMSKGFDLDDLEDDLDDLDF